MPNLPDEQSENQSMVVVNPPMPLAAWDEVRNPVVSKSQYAIGGEKTPDWAIKEREGKGGGTWHYVPHGYVVTKLNQAFGFDWDAQVVPIANGTVYDVHTEITSGKNGDRESRYLTVLVRLTVRVRDDNLNVISTISKDGFGSQEWQSKMEFGDALKGARSDGIKTAAMLLGIALDLYYDEEDALEQHALRELRKKSARELAEKMSRNINSENLTVVELSKFVGKSLPELLKLCDVSLQEFTANGTVKPEHVAKIRQELKI